jgi:hypothetical protein
MGGDAVVLGNVLAGTVAVLAVLMIITWVVRTILRERVRELATTGPSDVALIKKRRVRQLDHVLTEIGLACLLAAVGYVVLGVMPT